eukprot:1142260-Pelagomonas_calceolata.AAC.4
MERKRKYLLPEYTVEGNAHQVEMRGTCAFSQDVVTLLESLPPRDACNPCSWLAWRAEEPWEPSAYRRALTDQTCGEKVAYNHEQLDLLALCFTAVKALYVGGAVTRAASKLSAPECAAMTSIACYPCTYHVNGPPSFHPECPLLEGPSQRPGGNATVKSESMALEEKNGWLGFHAAHHVGPWKLRLHATDGAPFACTDQRLQGNACTSRHLSPQAQIRGLKAEPVLYATSGAPSSCTDQGLKGRACTTRQLWRSLLMHGSEA